LCRARGCPGLPNSATRACSWPHRRCERGCLWFPLAPPRHSKRSAAALFHGGDCTFVEGQRACLSATSKLLLAGCLLQVSGCCIPLHQIRGLSITAVWEYEAYCLMCCGLQTQSCLRCVRRKR
jgi:hypothetical protein